MGLDPADHQPRGMEKKAHRENRGGGKSDTLVMGNGIDKVSQETKEVEGHRKIKKELTRNKGRHNTLPKETIQE